MEISKATPYEVLDDVEVRIFQDKTSARHAEEFLTQQSREMFNVDPPTGDAVRSEVAPFRAELRLPNGEAMFCHLPEPPSEELLAAGDARTYGTALYRWLFREDINDAFTRTRSIAEASGPSADFGGNLRLRLWLDPRSEKLHSLWWETLYDPDRNQALSATMAFSRFMRVKSSLSRPVRERPLRLLLIASNPERLGRFDLTAMNLHLEKAILDQATQRLTDALRVDKELEPTVKNIRDRQASGNYHLIHLLAYAVVRDGRKVLILSDNDGRAQEVQSEEVVDSIVGGGEQPPRVVFLATPLASEEQTGRTLVGIAPQLVDAGVRAAVAIQSSIGEEQLVRFCTRFYEVLVSTGIVDVAVAAARTEIYEAHPWEWAAPVLYTGTPDAKLFHALPDSIKGMAFTM